MKIENYLAKYFDINVLIERDYSREGDSQPVKQVWVFEKGEDSEPLLVLYEANGYLVPADDPTTYRVGNVYSNLEHGLLITEEEVKRLAKAGGIKSQF